MNQYEWISLNDNNDRAQTSVMEVRGGVIVRTIVTTPTTSGFMPCVTTVFVPGEGAANFVSAAQERAS